MVAAAVAAAADEDVVVAAMGVVGVARENELSGEVGVTGDDGDSENTTGSGLRG